MDALLIKVQPKPAAEEAVRLRLAAFQFLLLKDEFTLKLTVKNLGVAAAQMLLCSLTVSKPLCAAAAMLYRYKHLGSAGKDVTVKMGLAQQKVPFIRSPSLSAVSRLPVKKSLLLKRLR